MKKTQLLSFSQPSVMIPQRRRTLKRLVARHVSWRERQPTLLVHKTRLAISLFTTHTYLLQAQGEERPQITPRRASMTVRLPARHKILFTAQCEEKLQLQSSPEERKAADLATLSAGPGGGSATIIIILLLLIHCRYLYSSHSLQGIQHWRQQVSSGAYEKNKK